ncbi:hypothetical protein D3C74_317980 [compost metagenome]
MDLVPFLLLRLLGVGDVRSAAVRRQAGDCAAYDGEKPGTVPAAAEGASGDDPESDADVFLPVASRGVGGEWADAESSQGHLRWRGTGAAAAEGVEEAIPGYAADQYVRNHRNDSTRDIQGNHRGGNRRGEKQYRKTDSYAEGIRAGCELPLCASGRSWGNVCGWRRSGARVLEPPRADGGEIRGRSVCAWRADVQIRGPGEMAARWQYRIPGTDRPSGEDPWIPD